jgi:hypothetical protein
MLLLYCTVLLESSRPVQQSHGASQQMGKDTLVIGHNPRHDGSITVFLFSPLLLQLGLQI